MQVTGETQGKRRWKARGGMPWAPRASSSPRLLLPSSQEALSWAAPSTAHLLKVEKPGPETWQS